MNRARRGLGAIAVGLSVACGGASQDEHAAPDTAAALSTGGGGGEITAAMVALGSEVFHGRVANGICYTCHGVDAAGGPGGLGPNLTDGEWLHNDGSYGGIVETVRGGVSQPVNAPGPMPPMGGASLSDEQLRAVAAYVYSLSHPEVPQAPSG